jgi:hypothetical protein
MGEGLRKSGQFHPVFQDSDSPGRQSFAVCYGLTARLTVSHQATGEPMAKPEQAPMHRRRPVADVVPRAHNPRHSGQPTDGNAEIGAIRKIDLENVYSLLAEESGQAPSFGNILRPAQSRDAQPKYRTIYRF